jgi:hypothetical protein
MKIHPSEQKRVFLPSQAASKPGEAPREGFQASAGLEKASFAHIY